MNHDECEMLDSYLADDVPAEAAARFEAHLAECAACRDAADQQRWIDDLLRSPSRQELEAAPADLAESVRRAMGRRRRRVRLMAGGLAAAAAALLVAAGWTVLTVRQADHPTIAVVDAAKEPSPNPSLRGRGNQPPPRAEFVGGPDVIVVPVATSHPNVTVVRVYPTYQPSYPVQASVEQPAAGNDFAWPLDFNDLNGG